jgi:hypothetical protein
VFAGVQVRKTLNTMTQKEIEQSVNDLNGLIIQGKMMEAFEKYYHEDVAMRENNQPPMIGKSANRQRELEFLDNIVEFRGAAAKGTVVAGDTSFVIWDFDYTHKQWGERKYTQISVQQWKDNRIVQENFYYGN